MYNTAPVKMPQAISDIDTKFASRRPVQFNRRRTWRPLHIYWSYL